MNRRSFFAVFAGGTLTALAQTESVNPGLRRRQARYYSKTCRMPMLDRTCRYPTCDLYRERCLARFDNIENFRGDLAGYQSWVL